MIPIPQTNKGAYQVMTDLLQGKYSTKDIVTFLEQTSHTPPAPKLMAAFLGAVTDSVTDSIDTSVLDKPVIDIVGTGGDGKKTANISTLAALVCASTGLVKTAKYGNRSATSICGSMDILEAAGIPVELTAKQAQDNLTRFGFTPLYARSFLSGAKYVAEARTAFGKPSIFNFLFPIARPVTGPISFVFGVANKADLARYADMYVSLGTANCLLVHGADDTDELSICDRGVTDYILITGKKMTSGQFNCQEAFGITPVKLAALQIDSKEEAVAVFRNVINPVKKDRKTAAVRQAALANAAAALSLALSPHDVIASVSGYYELAANALYAGKTQELFAQLKG